MSTETEDPRVRLYSRIAKAGLIGFFAAFGSLIVLIFLPVSRSIDMIAASVAILAMIASVFTLIAAIAARDIPAWRKNRWRFSTHSLLNLMLAVGMGMGGLAAAIREVSVGRLLLAYLGFFVAAIVVNIIYINSSRLRHFNALNAQGRYLDWSTVADHLSRGEGTALLAPCYQVPTVWWSERRICSVDEARAAIESDAVITICPQRKLIVEWLKSKYPAVPVVDISTGTVHCDT